ncbi:TonB-dependent receptor [Sphingomonas sp.]|uniref:TonB-dependent receptor n=1 Tax=Sphingomonas sp. TaxID=28214 RepID=UPI002FD9BD02
MKRLGTTLAGLLASASPLVAHAQTTGAAQQQPSSRPAQAPAQESDPYGEEIVITAGEPRGSVKGDIPPEITLNQADIRAYAVSSVADLLTELAPQTGSGRGSGMPVVLLNGRRISSFAEIRDLPTEAIERVDILPEEVALKFGYSANQRVVNFVLRQRFRALTTELEGGVPTQGGNSTQQVQADILKISRDRRVNLDVKYQGTTGLLESDRNVQPTFNDGSGVNQAPYRTLVSPSQDLTINGSYARNLNEKVGATVNGTLEVQQSEALRGLALSQTAAPLALSGDPSPLTASSRTITAHLGTTLNGDGLPWSSAWSWSLTGNYDRTESKTITDRGFDSRGLARPADRGESTSNVGNVDALLRGPLFKLPAGDVSTSLRIGGSLSSYDSTSFRGGAFQPTNPLTRNIASTQLNIDVPIASRRRDVLQPLGDLTINGNVAVQHLSDFGTLTTTGYGVNWSPFKPVRFLASWTDAEDAPTTTQLGGPLIANPNTRVFDYRTGQTVTITTITGGNPLLQAESRHVMKLGLELRPLESADLSFRADYVSTRVRNDIAGLPAATAAIEAAFPSRFVRDPATDELISIDNRAVNFAENNTRQLRWGFNLSVPIKSSLEKKIAALRAQREKERADAIASGKPLPPEGQAGLFGQRQGQNGQPPRSPFGGSLFGPPPGAAQGAPAGGAGPGAGPGGGGRPGGGRGFGGPNGGLAGRLQFSLYHTWYFKDQIKIRDGVPILDLLNGDAAGNAGGQPAHQIDAQAGITKDGVGVRLGFKWQSSTSVYTGLNQTNRLDFGDLGTFNLRLFADLGRQFKLVRAHPWLRGTRVSLGVTNILNTRQRVTDQTGAVPLNYQPDLLDPTGRAVRLSIRKLFF